MTVRAVAIGTIDGVDGLAPLIADLGGRFVVGRVVAHPPGAPDGPGSLVQVSLGPFGPFGFRLVADEVGIPWGDRRLHAMAAAAAGCHPNELVVVGADPVGDVAAPQSLGCRAVLLDRRADGAPSGVVPDAVISSLAELSTVLDRFAADDAARSGRPRVGPHPEPWPIGGHLDPVHLAEGARRNEVDRYP